MRRSVARAARQAIITASRSSIRPFLPSFQHSSSLPVASSSRLQARWYSEQATSNACGCPTCHKPIPSSSTSSSVLSHCPSCNSFLPPSSSELNYFKLFDLPEGYSISKPTLKRKFLEWQGRVHPDRLQASSSTNGTQQEDWAKTWSALVNEGYKTLNNDRTRGEYLLSQRGVQIEEQDKMEDPELLMEILEVREALEEAQTEEEVQVIRDSNTHMHQETLDSLQQCLAEESLDAQKAKALLIRMTYQQNVENICREWQPGKEIVLQH